MMGDHDSLQGQRTADDVSLRVATTVDTIDQALTWIVRQLDQRELDFPHIGIGPMWNYALESEETQQYFEVWIKGTPKTAGERGGP